MKSTCKQRERNGTGTKWFLDPLCAVCAVWAAIMKASFFTKPGQFEYRETGTPSVGDAEVLIRNKICGICGTDVHIFHGEPGSADVQPPVILGHEYSGEVVTVGASVATLKPGDHVTVDPNIYCGKCEYCRNGKKQLCTGMQAIGVTRNGGFSEYSVVPEAQAFLIREDIPYEYAAMTEPLACCLHGIDLAEIKPGDTVLVVGGGAIGLILLQLAKLAGAAKLILSEPNERRRAVAEKLGADCTINPLDRDAQEQYYGFTGSGADVVIECAGNNASVSSAFSFAKKGATIVLFSVPKPDAVYELGLFDVFKKELTIKGSFVNPDTHLRAVELLGASKIDFSDIITHTYKLDQLADAIAMQTSAESIKVVVDCSAE